MKIKIAFALFSLLLFTYLTPKAYAAFTTPCPKHTPFLCKEQVQKMIADAIAPLQTAINNLTGRTTALENKVNDLETRVAKLEASESAELTPTPSQITVPANGKFTVPNGTQSMSITITPSSGSLPKWALDVSFDNGNTYLEQVRYDGSVSQANLPVLSNQYILGSGGGTNFSGTISFNTVPNAKSLLLGQNVSYPFTSNSFDTTGYSTILITEGGGNNPQNVTGLSLQQLQNGNFVETQHLTCDGGDQCPYQSLPLSGGTYKVVLQGNGSGAVLGALLY